jgi:hypothetical protein
MQDPILCRYRWTLDEFLIANKQLVRHSRPARVMSRIFWVIALFLLFAGILRSINLGFDKVSYFCLAAGGVLLISRLFFRRIRVRMFERMPDRNSEILVQIYPDRLVIETGAARTETAWSRIASCTRTDEGFLLHLQPGAFYWLPFHGFTGPANIERVEQLLRSQEKL